MSNRTKHLDLVIAGNITLDDTIVPGGNSVENAPGGDALYAAIGAHLWGVRVGMFSRVGEDYPQAHLDELQRMGIDTAGIRRCTGSTVHYRILYENANVRQFIHLTPPARLTELSPEAADLPETYQGALAYHVAAMPTLLQAALVASFIQQSAMVALDPYEEDVADCLDSFLKMLHQHVAFFPSELEMGLIAEALGEAKRWHAHRVAAAWLCQQGCSLVSIKLGASGSLTRSTQDGRCYRLPVFPAHIVDPTGAGDAFCGGFLAGLIRYGSPVLAAACGTVSASLIIEGFGAMHALQSGKQEREQRLGYLLKAAGFERNTRG